jgi:two-component system, OmpR family, response regulator MprA
MEEMGKSKILVVEDDEITSHMLKSILAKEGYQVITAADGVEGLRKFLEEKPDLLLTDCLLPKMDGFKMVKRARAERDSRSPIIMMSAIYRKVSYHQAAIDAGADEYMIKPFEPEELIQNIKRLLAGAAPA